MSTLTIKDYTDLMQCFCCSVINRNFEFVADTRSNTYFRLDDCHNLRDIQVKVLKYLSRSAFKTEPYRSKKKNYDFHCDVMRGINQYLGTNFTTEDMGIIYQELGNGVNHKLTIEFIESGYDMNVLKEN